ncbi:MAG TPA: DUF4129 domain-containing protein, partial [Pseudomonadales bacterium]|nr:DUF4129 domain-containing protein [Pseudomonadales bacterium]
VILLKRPDRPLDPVDREYMRFCAALGRHGLARRVGEGPLDYAQRVSAERPDLAAMVGDVTSTYIELNYGAGNAELPQLRRTVRALRLKALA